MKDPDNHTQKSSNVPFIISFSLMAVMVASYFIFPSVKEFINEGYDVLTSDNEQSVKTWVSQFGMMGPVVIIIVMILQMFLFVIPNILLMMISILSYGPIWGSVIAFIGVFAASSVGYVIGNKLGPVTLNKFVSTSTQNKLTDFIKQYGMGAIAVTRLSSLSNDALSFVAGILKMPYLKFISATLAGITPLIITLAIFGRNGKIEKALIWIGAVSLVFLIAYIIIDKRRKKKSVPEPEEQLL